MLLIGCKQSTYIISISIHVAGVVRTGEFEEALSMYEQAYLLHPSDKLKDKINKIKVCGHHINQNIV